MDTTATATSSRRKFLKQTAGVGAGLTLGFHLPAGTAQAAKGGTASASAAATADAAGREVNAWVVVRPDNTVTIRYARSEMGQGSSTAAPMMVAEELNCDWKQVRMEFASPNEHVRRQRVWGSMASVGSYTIRTSQQYLREAGAAARDMLVRAAAQRWGVAPAECGVALGVITHTPSGRTLSFGDVAEAAALLPPPKTVRLKDPKDWTIIGQPLARFDIPDTVVGRQRFGIDVQLPGMLYAAVLQSPVFGGTVKTMDASALSAKRGFVRVVPIEGGVAVVADSWWRAKEMTRLLVIEWDEAGNGQASSASIVEHLRAGLALPSGPAMPVARLRGDVDQAFAQAPTVIEAEYHTPFLAHATLEPQVCTALVKHGRVTVWTSTQNADATMQHAATTAGVPLENVEVHRMQIGGGFGRRGGAQDFTRQGVTIAMAMPGTPVKMLWTREEDTQHDFYRPAALYRLRASLDKDGQPTGWTTRIAAPSIFATLVKAPLKDGLDPSAIEGFSDFPYAIPNQRMEYAQRDTHVPVGFWRAVGHSQNPFARECFLDELAVAARQDPCAFRRKLLADEARPLGVVNAAARTAGWGKPLAPGVFRGIAVTEPYGSYTAAVIEASVSDKGVVKIHRIVMAVDCGYVVNPDTVKAQTQGSAVFGLSAIFDGEVTIKNGRIEQSNFIDYPLMRLADMPPIEVVLVPSGGFWGGVGEATLAPLAPALCNAIFAATGRRIRSLPLKNHGLTRA